MKRLWMMIPENLHLSSDAWSKEKKEKIKKKKVNRCLFSSPVKETAIPPGNVNTLPADLASLSLLYSRPLHFMFPN